MLRRDRCCQAQKPGMTVFRKSPGGRSHNSEKPEGTGLYAWLCDLSGM